MRRDHQRLLDMVEALDSLARILKDQSEADFLANEVVRYAVAQRLTVVGEAAARMGEEIRTRYAAVPWADVVAFRNILVHEYFGVYWPLVWVTATEQAPALREQIAEIVRAEFPRDS